MFSDCTFDTQPVLTFNRDYNEGNSLTLVDKDEFASTDTMNVYITSDGDRVRSTPSLDKRFEKGLKLPCDLTVCGFTNSEGNYILFPKPTSEMQDKPIKKLVQYPYQTKIDVKEFKSINVSYGTANLLVTEDNDTVWCNGSVNKLIKDGLTAPCKLIIGRTKSMGNVEYVEVFAI